MTAVPELDPRRHPGPIGFRISATGSAGLEYGRVDETWHLAHELDAFDAGWTSDHLTDASEARGGPALEALTTIATLVHRVPGRWVGIAVVSATVRHPAVLAKAATALDVRAERSRGGSWSAGAMDHHLAGPYLLDDPIGSGGMAEVCVPPTPDRGPPSR